MHSKLLLANSKATFIGMKKNIHERISVLFQRQRTGTLNEVEKQIIPVHAVPMVGEQPAMSRITMVKQEDKEIAQ